MPSKSLEIIPAWHSQGELYIPVAIGWPDFGGLAALPLGPVDDLHDVGQDRGQVVILGGIDRRHAGLAQGFLVLGGDDAAGDHRQIAQADPGQAGQDFAVALTRVA